MVLILADRSNVCVRSKLYYILFLITAGNSCDYLYRLRDTGLQCRRYVQTLFCTVVLHLLCCVHHHGEKSEYIGGWAKVTVPGKRIWLGGFFYHFLLRKPQGNEPAVTLYNSWLLEALVLVVYLRSHAYCSLFRNSHVDGGEFNILPY